MLYRLARENPFVYNIEKGSNTHLPLLQQGRAPGGKGKDQDNGGEGNEDEWRTIKGSRAVEFYDEKDDTYRCFVVLKEDGKTVLQRMGLSSFDALTQARKCSAEGLQLLDEVLKVATPNIASQSRSDNDLFHFGIWPAQGHVTPVVSSDTLQGLPKMVVRNDKGPSQETSATSEEGVGRRRRGNVEAKEKAATAAIALCVWVQDYVTKYVMPLLTKADSGMDEAVRETYKGREAVYEWLKSQECSAEVVHLAHPMYCTFSPFKGFSNKAHVDKADGNFTMLVNFGASCNLVLDDYKIKVNMQPFDVVFFHSNRLKHRTEAVPGSETSEQRWAISAYTRSSLEKQAGLAAPHYSSAVAGLAHAVQKKKRKT